MMFEFILMVVLANAIMLACLYILRHVIAIRAPVLLIAVGISIFYCILYPFLVARVPYPKVLYLYAVFIMIGAAILYIIETRFFSVEEIGDNEVVGMPVGDALAVVEGKRLTLNGLKGRVNRLSLKERIKELPPFNKISRIQFSQKEQEHPGDDLKTGQLETDSAGLYARELADEINRAEISPDSAFETISEEAGQSDKTADHDLFGEAYSDTGSQEFSGLEQPARDRGEVEDYTSTVIEADAAQEKVQLQEEPVELKEEAEEKAEALNLDGDAGIVRFSEEYCSKEIVEVQKELSADESQEGHGEAAAAVMETDQSFAEQDSDEITDYTVDIMQDPGEISGGAAPQEAEVIAEDQAGEIIEGTADISDGPEQMPEETAEQLVLMNSNEEGIPPVSLYMLDILDVISTDSADVASDGDSDGNGLVSQDHPDGFPEETEITEGEEAEYPKDGDTKEYEQYALVDSDIEEVSAIEAVYEPVVEPEAPKPVEDQEVEGPVNEPELEELVKEPDMEEPFEEPEVEATAEEPEAEEPAEEPEVEEPVDEPEVEEPPDVGVSSGDISGKAEADQELTGESQINIMVARAFDSLASGDGAGAVEEFFRVLKMEPPPKLAVMLCIEISSIYLAGGHKRQALAVLEMLEVVWGHALDSGDSEEVKIKIKRLKGEI